MKSAVHFLMAMSHAAAAPSAQLFDSAPERADMMQLIYREAFLDRTGARGPELHETWFVRNNGAVLSDAWRSYTSTLCCEGSQETVELEIVAHLPTDGQIERRYAQTWTRLAHGARPAGAAGHWLGEVRAPHIERHVHRGEQRTVEQAGAAAVTMVKKEVSRSALEVPSQGRPHRVAVHVSTERPCGGGGEAALPGRPCGGGGEAAVDTVRYKCVQELESGAWRLALICELVAASADSELRDISEVERVLTTKEMEFAGCVALLRSEPQLARAVLGIDIDNARVTWRVELELVRPESCAALHRGAVAALAVFSALQRGPESVARPLSASFVSVALLCAGGGEHQQQPGVSGLVERARALALTACHLAAEQLASARRPHELTVATLPATVSMAVTPKDDGVECTLFVVPGGAAWCCPGGRWFWRDDVQWPSPAVLAVELMADGVLVINDAWVLPGHMDAWQWPDLMRRVKAYTEYAGRLPPGCGVRAKPWFYTPEDDRADLAGATALILDEYPRLGLVADGLVFCSLRDGVRGRVLYKFKPRLTVDLRVGADRRLLARSEDQLVPVEAALSEDLPVGECVAEFAVLPERRLRFVKVRADKEHPNLLRAAEEMFATEAAFRGRRGGMDLMLRLRNGARRFRHEMNRAKRRVLEECAGFRVFVDLGVGTDILKYGFTDAKHIVGVDLSEERLAEARKRAAARLPGVALDLLRGSMNDAATRAALKAAVGGDGEPVTVVSNWTLAYGADPQTGDLSDLLRFVADVAGPAGQFVGIVHFTPELPPPSSEGGPSLFGEEDGLLCGMDPLLDLAVGAAWRCALPAAAAERYWSGGEAAELRCWKLSSCAVVALAGRRAMWILLDATAPNHANFEYVVTADALRAACASVGFELTLASRGDLKPEATAFRAHRPRLTLSRARCCYPCPVPPLDGPTALPAWAEPVAVPCAGQTVWCLWVTRRRCAFLYHPDGRSFRLHGLSPSAPPCVLRVFFNEGRLVAFDILELAGRSCADEPFLATRHPQLRAALGQWVQVAPVYAWDDLEGLASAAACVGRLYLAANRRACCPPLHALRFAARGDLLFMLDGSCVREPPCRTRTTPIAADAHAAALLRAVAAVDAQVPGGTVDSVYVEAPRSPAGLREALRRWARLCGCKREPVFEDAPAAAVRALVRPRAAAAARPEATQRAAVVCEVARLQPGRREPWVGEWDRVGTDDGECREEEEAVVVDVRDWHLLLDAGFRPKRAMLRLDYNWHEELECSSL